MGAVLVILLQPGLQVRLQVVYCPIDLLSERHAVKLVQHGLVESFTDPLGLRMPRFRPGGIDVLHR